MLDLTYIIVNYNVTEHLRNCLQSILQYSHGFSFEIIVVDNNSPDQSWKELAHQFPDVKWIAGEENVGFAKANNRAAALAKGEFLYFLNPDTELKGDYILELLQFARAKQEFGALGLRMHDKSGHFLPESKRSVPDMFNSFAKLFKFKSASDSKSYYRNDIAEDAVAEVEILTGANLLIKRETYLAAGGFDEAYFMYGEDIDLCYTLLRSGLHNWYYGKYSLLHHKGESTVKDDVYLQRFYGAMHIFVDKYYAGRPLTHRILSAGLQFRKFIEALKQKRLR